VPVVCFAVGDVIMLLLINLINECLRSSVESINHKLAQDNTQTCLAIKALTEAIPNKNAMFYVRNKGPTSVVRYP